MSIYIMGIESGADAKTVCGEVESTFPGQGTSGKHDGK